MSQTYKAFQSSMHVNDIQIDRQRFYIILQSFHHFFFHSSPPSIVNVMLQPLHSNLNVSKSFSKMHGARYFIMFKFEFIILIKFN